MHAEVRRPLFDGMREVRAVWFDAELIGEETARLRVLAHWQPGSRLYRVLDGYLLEFAQPKYLRCTDSEGLPLCDVGGILASAPLTPEEKAALPPGRICLVRGARAHVLSPNASDSIDPSIWVNLDAIPVREPLPLSPAGLPVRIEHPEDSKSVRDILGESIPQASTERDVFLRDLKASLSGEPTVRKPSGRDVLPLAGTVALGVLGLLGGWIGSALRSGRSAQATASPGQKPSGLSPAARWLSNALGRLAMMTRISKVLGWRQAAYLRSMLEMFESGNLDEALRHAIPLGAFEQEAARPAFGTPGRREHLHVTGRNRTAAGIGLAGELEQYLRQTYRRTFERLDREGRIDEAVFVLAELLKVGHEAVTYLERKGRARQAAELAETMELSADVMVRLWWLAGDAKRAARLARLHNAFADAVRLLERSQHPDAGELRLAWAEHLAMRGELAEAAEAIWPLKDHHHAALAWLQQAERSGGHLGVRALVRRLILQPDGLPGSMPAISAILDAPGEEGASVRARLAAELIAVKEHSSATRKLAGAVLPGVLADRMAGSNRMEKRDLNRLLEVSGNTLLKADLPSYKVPGIEPMRALRQLAAPLEARLEDRGMWTLHDACRLLGGQYLLALGESGVVRIDRFGRQLAHFPVPAHSLVIADNRQRALALARRDTTFRVSRIDLSTGKVSDWLSAPLAFWADRYDGAMWNAVLDNRLVAIDTSQDHLAIAWQVKDLPGKIIGFAETPHGQAIVLAEGRGVGQWRYELPARRLLQRDSWELEGQGVWGVFPNSGPPGPYALRLVYEEKGVNLAVSCLGGTSAPNVLLENLPSAPVVQIRGGWLAAWAEYGDDMRCQVVDLLHGKVRSVISLPRGEHPRVRLDEDGILMFDRASRLVDIDCESSQLRTLVLS